MDEKKVKLEEGEDRISGLPDCLIHHILCFLPSTKQSIQTGLLSKRWRYLWTQVPLVTFDPSGMSQENFFKFIETALGFLDRFSFKIKRFELDYGFHFDIDPQFDKIISLTTRKNVEHLRLVCYSRRDYDSSYMYKMPHVLFSYANLVVLRVHACKFVPSGAVNWKHLKLLILFSCHLPDQVIECVVSGSPLLETLILQECDGFEKLVIGSKPLKRLILTYETRHDDLLVLCPNLENLYLQSPWPKTGYFTLSTRAIENVLLGSPLLKLLEIDKCNGFDKLVIASKILQRLVLKEVEVCVVEISCPNLEQLELENLRGVKSFKLADVPFSATSKTDWGKAFVDSKAFSASWCFAAPERAS